MAGAALFAAADARPHRASPDGSAGTDRSGGDSRSRAGSRSLVSGLKSDHA